MNSRICSPNRLLALSIAAVASLSPVAGAQGFNVDFDDLAGGGVTCASSYAAAGTAGTWNSADQSLGTIFPLVDKSGNTTPVQMVVSGMGQSFYFYNPVYLGEDANLMQDLGYGSGVDAVDFTALANGSYNVYTYALAPDHPITWLTTVDCTQSIDGLQVVGGAVWPGHHQQGLSYALHSATVTNGTLHLDIRNLGGPAEAVLGIQIEPVGPSNSGNAYCFGDGTGATCPCLGFGGTGEGCANTSGTGAILTGSGDANLGNDTFQLSIAGVPGNKPGLLLRGNNQLAVPAGDGILCTAGASQRSHVQVTVAGSTTFTDFSGMSFGAVSNVGSPTNFQFWYRDPSATCSGGGFNFTNGWTVTY